MDARIDVITRDLGCLRESGYTGYPPLQESTSVEEEFVVITSSSQKTISGRVEDLSLRKKTQQVAIITQREKLATAIEIGEATITTRSGRIVKKNIPFEGRT